MRHVCNPNQTVEPAQSAHRLPRLRVFVGVKIAPTIARQLAQFSAVPRDHSSARLRLPIFTSRSYHRGTYPPDPTRSPSFSGVVAGFGAFPLLFQHVSYGPQPKRPRLVWA